MDKDSVFDYVKNNMHDGDMTELIRSMSDIMTEEQFKSCLRPILMKKCSEYSDVEWDVSNAIEWSWNDIDYYDDDYGEGTQENTEAHVKDSFYYVVVMLDADLIEEAVSACRKIVDALDAASKNPKYSSYTTTLVKLRDDLEKQLELGDPRPWFEY